MRRAATILLLVLASTAALAATREEKPKPSPAPSPAPAAEPAKQAKEESPAPQPRYDVKKDDVITNEDLERMMSELSPTEARSGVYQAKPEPVKPGAAPAAPGEQPPPKPGSKTQQVTDAEGKVAALQARVSELEKAVLAVKNPLLPRTWATPDSMKDQDQEAGFEAKDNAARLTQREAELKAAREELSRAREELATARGGSSSAP
jgi:hypothetical protein